MARRMYVTEQWNSFAQIVLPKECSDLQRKEMRRAFFAGAVALWEIFFRGLTDGDDVNPQDLEKMADLQAEFGLYLERLKRGAA